ncbi:glyoxylase-like metal-dependent hydrolase (beta-lactamase superfamily II) [Nitrosospira multiformis]|uniref:Glyoxylase-like metal-dependent hydrolase (Beta-lactamase superfamily II) n=1 Tax=Nitrosospira multiformis TaxID=1231 RepID=A0A2T5IGR9_9PROT|nr:MBL fold metallo-hydrolase [Nitrosospira multiformis]PTQ83018.1 glyoxylase-like metal-dependent hydrolase (beta-lactamase superfamily II) [Nitrosospira multiformis]
MKPRIEAFFESVTATISYVVYDEPGGSCAIIDPVLDYDPKAGRTTGAFADKLIAFVEAKKLKVEWILETHVHADHLTAASYLKERLDGKTGIGPQISTVQQIFKKMFNLGAEFVPDGRHFNHVFADGEIFTVGKLTAKAVFTPGHTPADLSYQFDDAVFIGDTMFMPDLGTARADFPGGDARQLFRSIKRLLANPPQTRLFMCHDYPPATRQPQWECIVADQRAGNIHVHDGITEDDFVAMRTARDKTLGAPVLLLPSIQVNIRAGEMPPPEDNGVAYLKIPLNVI